MNVIVRMNLKVNLSESRKIRVNMGTSLNVSPSENVNEFYYEFQRRVQANIYDYECKYDNESKNMNVGVTRLRS